MSAAIPIRRDHPEQQHPIAGCMTGAATEIMERLERAATSAHLQRFLYAIARASFSTAGYQAQAGWRDGGTHCQFDLSAWAEQLGWRRQEVYRLRQQAIELGFLSYEPAADDPGAGILHWNLDYSQWRALDADYRRGRYDRRSQDRRSAQAQHRSPGSTVSERNSFDPAEAIKTITPDRSEPIKRITLVRSEPAPMQAEPEPLRRDTEEREKKLASAPMRPHIRVRGEPLPDDLLDQAAAILLAIPGWRDDRATTLRALDLLMTDPSHPFEPEWLVQQASLFALRAEASPSAIRYHKWLTNATAKRMYAQWYRQRLAAERAAMAGALGGEDARRAQAAIEERTRAKSLERPIEPVLAGPPPTADPETRRQRTLRLHQRMAAAQAAALEAQMGNAQKGAIR